ncbi:MAG: hypothetical protein K6E35_07415 [Bacteroidales bacterium]|nr:hypothetical protein [Bacteroidales bacterium]
MGKETINRDNDINALLSHRNINIPGIEDETVLGEGNPVETQNTRKYAPSGHGKVGRPKKKELIQSEAICTRLPSEDVSKLRIIAANEMVSFSDVIRQAIQIAIRKYENAHGTINVQNYIHEKNKKIF